MAEKSVIVVGAGLAGLAAGIYARVNGYETKIFEHHNLPGGVVACWKRKGYFIDGGIHFLMGHRPGHPAYDLYGEVGALDGVEVIDMPSYMQMIDEETGRSVEIGSDLDRLERDLVELSPEDVDLIADFIGGAREMTRVDMGATSVEPPELSGFVGTVREVWEMRAVLKYMFGKYMKPVKERAAKARDPFVRDVLQYLFLPDVPVWFAAMVLALASKNQLGLLQDGCLDFIMAMKRRYEELGGELECGATVEEILVEDGRAVGVKLAGGSEHRAGHVISAADGYYTLYNMLGGKYLDEDIEDRFENWAPCDPVVMASFGVARDFAGEPWLKLFMLLDPIAVGEREVRVLPLRIFNYGDKFAPAGKTVIQAMIETDWKHWKSLADRDREAYEAEKERVAGEIVARLERHYPGLGGQVEMADVATPWTTYRYTLNYKGAYEGWFINPKTITTKVKRTVPGLDNFVMAGQWVLPGGGVPTCIATGKDAVRIMCKRDGIEFKSK